VATHTANGAQPYPITYARRARNGTPVNASTYSDIANATNHIIAYRRKWLAQFANSVVPAGASGTLTSWRAYIHTGHHCKQIRGDFILCRPDNALAVDPVVAFALRDVGTGALVAASTTIHYGPIDAAATDVPDERIKTVMRIDGADFADDTDYWLQVYAYDYARIASASFWELGTLDGVVDDAITGAVDPRFAAGGPITDDQPLALAAAQTEIIRTNRPSLFSWSTYDATSNDHVGVTATNMLDLSSTTVTAATPGWYVNNLYHNTVSRTTVPVVFAVYASSTGIGGVNASLRLTDGTQTITIGSITASGWYTGTGLITAAAATKFDIHGFSDSASRTTHLYAATLFEYE